MLPDDIGLPEGVEPLPLSGAPLRNWLSTNISPDMYASTSGAELLDFLRLNGVSIRTADFYDIRAGVLYNAGQVAGLRRDLSSLSALQPDSLIPMGYTIFDHGYDLSDNFLYRVAMTGYDPDTGEQIRSFMSVASYRQLTFQEVSDLVGSLIGPEGTNSTPNIQSWTLDAAFGRPELLR